VEKNRIWGRRTSPDAITAAIPITRNMWHRDCTGPAGGGRIRYDNDGADSIGRANSSKNRRDPTIPAVIFCERIHGEKCNGIDRFVALLESIQCRIKKETGLIGKWPDGLDRHIAVIRARGCS
jgi:hypothetical protein